MVKRARARRTASKIPQPAPPSTLNLLATGAKASAPVARGSHGIHTIVYVHGIGNKPPASVLKCQWDTALFGGELGDRSRMAYWVNRDYYPVPETGTCASGDLVRVDDDEMSTKAVQAITQGDDDTDEKALDNEIQSLSADDTVRQEWLRKVAAKIKSNADAMEKESRTASYRPGPGALANDRSALILPRFVRPLIVNRLTRAFLRDVNDFFFNKDRRDAMEWSLIERLSAGGGPFLVVAHSQGAMIAYDVLRRLDPKKVKVPLFVTIGAPLALEEVKDVLKEWTGGKLPSPPCVGKWLNFADRLDPVALDNTLADDFDGTNIVDKSGWGVNLDSPPHPHSSTGYLRNPELRTDVRDALGSAFMQSLAPFAIAKDLVDRLENGLDEERHPILIQLAEEGPAKFVTPRNLGEVGLDIESRIHDLMGTRNAEFDPGLAKVERLRHYVSASLTRMEIETLRSLHQDLQIIGIWRNGAKRALIVDSTNTVQAAPANLGYGADGRDICWAVFDTGIRADHPHFNRHANIKAQWDCTVTGPPQRLTRADAGFTTLDGHGHGTHVAGIIAGEYSIDDVRYAGMAPKTSLFGFKVLANDGTGNDAWIIKGLDVVATMNEDAGALVVHGINLSLGGAFDPSVYGCGHTPLCQELRRLWRQGVLICLAAGNEGFAVLSTLNGSIQANLDLSIGDPANLNEAIAVGSVHKTNPHTYGISYFSSRGPTADGRRKPDLVAPGERIISANYDWQRAGTTEDQYISMSGTSMATPHVSGVLSAFLSLRREFIGYPDRVKKILLNGCVDLERDPYMQGSGLPNLIKMLALG